MLNLKTILFILYLVFFSINAESQVVNDDKILRGHEYTVFCLDADKTGKYIVSGSYDTDVILWDYETGKQLKTFKGHVAGVWNVKISPDSKYVASGSWDNNNNAKGSSQNCLNILDLKTLDVIKSLSIYPDRYKILACIPEADRSSSNGICKILFNADGSKVASISHSGDLFIWDINDNFKRTVYNFSETDHDLVILSPDWNYVACTESKRSMIDTSFYLMRLGTNEVIANFNNPKKQ